MLINTVIIFLKDLLPIFILLGLLKANTPDAIVSNRPILQILSISILGVMATFSLLPSISELWEGAGIEIIQTIAYTLVYVCLVFSCSYIFENKGPSQKQYYVISFGLLIFIILKASIFIVLIEGYLINNESIKNIIAGLSIGLGLCLSFSFLLFFLLVWLNNNNKYYLVTYSFWALFLTGQVSQIVTLLQQVDLIKSSEVLWDSSFIIEDKSEYGHLLNTLFGYEARPSVEFILLYLGSLLVIFSYLFTHRYYQIERNKKSISEEVA